MNVKTRPAIANSFLMLKQLTQELASLESQSLRRRLQVIEEVLPGGRVQLDGRVLLNLSSNDYLGLAQDPRLIAAAQDAAARWGVGAGASRLVTGTWPCTPRRKKAGGLQRHPGRGHLQHRLYGQPGGDRRPGGTGGRGLLAISSTTPASTTASSSPGPPCTAFRTAT